MSSTPAPGGVIVVGSINQDLTVYAPSLPRAGETVLGTDFATSDGGKGANQAVAAARCLPPPPPPGPPRVHMVGRVGDDAMGSGLVGRLRGDGVGISAEGSTAGDGRHTGVASIAVDAEGRNTIVVSPGANLSLTPDDVDEALSGLLPREGGDGEEAAGGRDVVLVQLEIRPETALRALERGSASGALTVLNPAPAPEGWSLTGDWLRSVDVLTPNETEL